MKKRLESAEYIEDMGALLARYSFPNGDEREEYFFDRGQHCILDIVKNRSGYEQYWSGDWEGIALVRQYNERSIENLSKARQALKGETECV